MRRTDRWPPRSASGRTAATQLAASSRRRVPPPDQARTAAQRGVRRRRHLADEDAHGRTGGPVARRHQDDDGHDADAHLHQQVDRQRPVGPVRLQQAPVERQQDEEGRGGENRGDADAALLVEEHGHAVAAREHDHGPDEDDQRALAVDPPRPAAHEMAGAVLVPDGDPAHDGHHDGRARHGQDQVEAGELVEDAVAVRREEPGQRDGEDDAGAIGQHAGGGQRSRLQQPGPHRLDARSRVRVEEELGAQVRADCVGGQCHGRRHGLDHDLGRGGVRDLGVVHARAFAASSSMPIRSTAGRIWRCSNSPPSTLTWMPSAERTSTPERDAV